MTLTLKDFLEEALSQYRMHSRKPDEFIMYFASIKKNAFAWAARKDLINNKMPKLPPETYADQLAAGGVPGVAEMVRKIGILLEIEEEESAEAVPSGRVAEESSEGAEIHIKANTSATSRRNSRRAQRIQKKGG